MRLSLLFAVTSGVSAIRTELLFNDQWLFHLGSLPWTCSSPASATVFPFNLSNTFVSGLVSAPAGLASPSACAAQCAGDCSCQMWQFCPQLLSATTCNGTAPPPSIAAPPDCSNDTSSFPMPMNDIQCSGLNGVGADSEASCAAACCGDATCEIYQWCPPGGALDGGSSCGPPGSCWVGRLNAGPCKAESGWASRARNVTLGAACQVGLLADYGPGGWRTAGADGWVGAARLAPPAAPTQTFGPAAVAFDDSTFERVFIPHDYLARGTPTDVNATAHQNEHGSIPFSDAWYRKRFTIPTGTVAARLYFDGAYRSASVFLNGALAAQHEEG